MKLNRGIIRNLFWLIYFGKIVTNRRMEGQRRMDFGDDVRHEQRQRDKLKQKHKQKWLHWRNKINVKQTDNQGNQGTLAQLANVKSLFLSSLFPYQVTP
jgi:hypothetical protein